MTSALHLYTLPEHRRLDLVARFRHLNEREISDMLGRSLDHFGSTCPRVDKRRGHLPSVALLGDDGRWHLRLGHVMVCSVRARAFLDTDAAGPAPALGTVIHHEQLAHWWTDGSQYRIESRGPLIGSTGFRTVEWDVTLTGEEKRPDLVRPQQRCQISVHEGDWDPCRIAPRSSWRVHRRSEYIDAGGRMCHACGDSLAQDLEYDRHTRLIRGVLCQECASHVTECPHADGCYRAEYLNSPPAGHLRRTYYVGGNRDDRKQGRPRAA